MYNREIIMNVLIQRVLHVKTFILRNILDIVLSDHPFSQKEKDDGKSPISSRKMSSTVRYTKMKIILGYPITMVRKVFHHQRQNAGFSLSLRLFFNGKRRVLGSVLKSVLTVAIRVLMSSLPKCYRDEAIELFWGGSNPTIKEALQYFYGGIDYRISKINRLFLGKVNSFNMHRKIPDSIPADPYSLSQHR